MFFNDMKHGEGTFRWQGGNVYKGSYQNDVRHGYGVMTWTDGSVYSGQWERGMQHGKGRLQQANGLVKKGLFRENSFVEKTPHNLKSEKLTSEPFYEVDYASVGEDKIEKMQTEQGSVMEGGQDKAEEVKQEPD